MQYACSRPPRLPASVNQWQPAACMVSGRLNPHAPAPMPQNKRADATRSSAMRHRCLEAMLMECAGSMRDKRGVGAVYGTPQESTARALGAHGKAHEDATFPL